MTSRRSKPTVFNSHYDVDVRLKQLGLARIALVVAAQQGDFHARMCTSDDYSATSGFLRWARTYSGLTEQTRGTWHQGFFLTIPVLFSNDGRLAIAFTSGNDQTGIEGDGPVTKAKGPGTEVAVRESMAQQQFDIEDSVELWYLVYHDAADGDVRIELSRPSSTNELIQIDSWDERILIGRIDPGGAHAVTLPTKPPEIDIDVHRKHG